MLGLVRFFNVYAVISSRSNYCVKLGCTAWSCSLLSMLYLLEKPITVLNLDAQPGHVLCRLDYDFWKSQSS